MDLTYIGQNIRNRRKELGLTINDIHKKTGISTGNLSGIETGKSAPSAQAIIALSNVLKCTTDYLLLENSSDNYSILDIKESDLSENQKELLETYNSLDKRGQHKVHTIIYEELDRMEKEQIESKKDLQNMSIPKEIKLG